MLKNPFKYTGPLDPIKDKIVLVPRYDSLNRVTEGINDGKYWGILGLRQIGKTTFLRQIKNKLPNAYHIYMDFEVSPETEESFYQWLMREFLRISKKSDLAESINRKWKNYSPDFMFMKFLEEFIPQKHKKIILLFDEIEKIPFLKKFLHIWRKAYHDRDQQKQLNLYSLVVTGSAELIGLTKGNNSPFNIAELLYMDDFSDDESERLLDESFKKLKIEIDHRAKEKLLIEISGHPQLLQHACSKLVEKANEENCPISEKDIDYVINLLLNENVTIDTLRENLNEPRLEGLIRDILAGKKRKYQPYKEFSIKGAGPIIEDEDHCCAIRNKVYERFLIEYLDIPGDKPDFAARFTIMEQVGEGGMGIVYKAKDTVLKRTVAIKKLNSKLTKNKDNLNKFYKEASTTACLRHQNIVRIYDVKQIETDHFIIMEFIEGIDYEKIICKEKPLELPEILLVGKSLFTALEFFHRKGIIHRDIKPQNIMRDRENEIKILDFGIAALSMDKADEKDDSDYTIASPFYMSPEQIRGEEMGHCSDIYSAGITLFQLTTGQVPFEGKNPKETIQKHLNEPVPSIRALRPGVPFELAEVIEKCMQKKKEDRYQSAKEVLVRLEKIEAIITGIQSTAGHPKIATASNQTAVIPENQRKELESEFSSKTMKAEKNQAREKSQIPCKTLKIKAIKKISPDTW